MTDRGFINVDIQMRTSVPPIFAIGDIVGQPMLAHNIKPEVRGSRGMVFWANQGWFYLAAAQPGIPGR